MSSRPSPQGHLRLGWPVWLGVVCEDMEVQRRFYRDVLGLAEVEVGDDFAMFEVDGKLVELLARSPEPQYAQRGVSFAFEVDDIQAARHELIERGVDPVTDVEGGPPNSRQYWAYFKDAEENLFELVQRVR